MLHLSELQLVQRGRPASVKTAISLLKDKQTQLPHVILQRHSAAQQGCSHVIGSDALGATSTVVCIGVPDAVWRVVDVERHAISTRRKVLQEVDSGAQQSR